MITLHVGSSWAKVEYSNEDTDNQAARKLVSDTLSWFSDGYQFTRAYKARQWDGRKRLYNLRSHTFPAGLHGVLARTLEAAGYTVVVVDRSPRVEPFTPRTELPEIHDLTWTSAQKDALRVAQQTPRGVFQMSVATGKGELIAGILKMYPGPCVVLVNGRDLMYQTQERLTYRLQRDIGIIGDGIWNPRSTTVGLYQTLFSRINEEETREFLGRQKVLIVDETQHAPADTFAEVVRSCPAPIRYGFSATAFEKDPTGRPRTLRDAELVGLLGERIHQLRHYQVSVRVQIARFQTSSLRQAPYAAAHKADILENLLVHRFIAKWVRARVLQGQHR